MGMIEKILALRGLRGGSRGTQSGTAYFYSLGDGRTYSGQLSKLENSGYFGSWVEGRFGYVSGVGVTVEALTLKIPQATVDQGVVLQQNKTYCYILANT